MAISDNLNKVTSKIEQEINSGASRILLFCARLITGSFVSLTLGLIFQKIMGFEQIGLTFFCIVGILLFLKTTSSWTFLKIAVFNLIFILIGLVLRMYILVAPGL